MASVSDRLRQARGARGLSQRELSELSDTPQSQLSRIERGAIDPAFSTVVDLATAMRVSLDALVHATDAAYSESLEVESTELVVTMGIAPQTGRPFLVSRFASPSPHSIAVGDEGSGVDELLRLEVLRTLMAGVGVTVVDPADAWGGFSGALGGIDVDGLSSPADGLLRRIVRPVAETLSESGAWADALSDAGARSLLVLPPLESCREAADDIAGLAASSEPVALVLSTASAGELVEWSPVAKHCGWRWVVRQGPAEQGAVTSFLGSPHPETVVFGGGYTLVQTGGGDTALVSLDPTPAETAIIVG